MEEERLARLEVEVVQRDRSNLARAQVEREVDLFVRGKDYINSYVKITGVRISVLNDGQVSFNQPRHPPFRPLQFCSIFLTFALT